jgi:starch phosphorylase
VILGVGGVRMLRALGYPRLARFHMNEGHAALLALELLAEEEGLYGVWYHACTTFQVSVPP